MHSNRTGLNTFEPEATVGLETLCDVGDFFFLFIANIWHISVHRDAVTKIAHFSAECFWGVYAACIYSE